MGYLGEWGQIGGVGLVWMGWSGAGAGLRLSAVNFGLIWLRNSIRRVELCWLR